MRINVFYFLTLVISSTIVILLYYSLPMTRERVQKVITAFVLVPVLVLSGFAIIGKVTPLTSSLPSLVRAQSCTTNQYQLNANSNTWYLYGNNQLTIRVYVYGYKYNNAECNNISVVAYLYREYNTGGVGHWQSSVSNSVWLSSYENIPQEPIYWWTQSSGVLSPKYGCYTAYSSFYNYNGVNYDVPVSFCN
jgi:hypothetical protein